MNHHIFDYNEYVNNIDWHFKDTNSLYSSIGSDASFREDTINKQFQTLELHENHFDSK